jgi:hypothetical protein
MATVAFFDFLSHGEMHLPFNEGYLKVLLAAFPEDEIVCGAAAEHVANLRPAFADVPRLRFETVRPLVVARSRDAYLPWRGRPAARACWQEIERVIAAAAPRLVALGGADANLLAVLPKRLAARWGAPVHYVLHNHLAAARNWRTRNPLLRPFDFLSVFARPLPAGQSILALEPAIAEVVEAEFPAHRGRVVTLEHPVLESEWSPPRLPAPDGPLRVGFTGHCGRGKGFDRFVELAARFAGPDFAFHAIGRANPNVADLDLAPLARRPAPDGLDRPAFLEAVREMDLICLPLAVDSRYVASGSVIDAFAAAKPLLIPRNPMMRAIEARFGVFGPSAASRDDVVAFFAGFDRAAFAAAYPTWLQAVGRIRESRAAGPLATAYRAAFEQFAA